MKPTHTYQSEPGSWHHQLPVLLTGESDQSGLIAIVTLPYEAVQNRIVMQYGEADRHLVDDEVVDGYLRIYVEPSELEPLQNSPARP